METLTKQQRFEALTKPSEYRYDILSQPVRDDLIEQVGLLEELSGIITSQTNAEKDNVDCQKALAVLLLRIGDHYTSDVLPILIKIAKEANNAFAKKSFESKEYRFSTTHQFFETELRSLVEILRDKYSNEALEKCGLTMAKNILSCADSFYCSQMIDIPDNITKSSGAPFTPDLLNEYLLAMNNLSIAFSKQQEISNKLTKTEYPFIDRYASHTVSRIQYAREKGCNVDTEMINLLVDYVAAFNKTGLFGLDEIVKKIKKGDEEKPVDINPILKKLLNLYINTKNNYGDAGMVMLEAIIKNAQDHSIDQGFIESIKKMLAVSDSRAFNPDDIDSLKNNLLVRNVELKNLGEPYKWIGQLINLLDPKTHDIDHTKFTSGHTEFDFLWSVLEERLTPTVFVRVLQGWIYAHSNLAFDESSNDITYRKNIGKVLINVADQWGLLTPELKEALKMEKFNKKPEIPSEELCATVPKPASWLVRVRESIHNRRDRNQHTK
jgi:hypothetical protein